jgi:hypothetical protein
MSVKAIQIEPLARGQLCSRLLRHPAGRWCPCVEVSKRYITAVYAPLTNLAHYLDGLKSAFNKKHSSKPFLNGAQTCAT